MSGKIAFISQGFFKCTTEVIPIDIKNEGPVISVLYRFGMVVFATSKAIRVVHYRRGKQRVTIVKAPLVNEILPDHLYQSNQAKPIIFLMEDKEEFNGLSYPNVFMYVAWFNQLLKYKIYYIKKEDKFGAKSVFSKDLGNCYICGLNV